MIVGLLTLVFAAVDSSASIGPLGAAGVAVALFLSLTLLPATLAIAGRRAFWPYIPESATTSRPRTRSGTASAVRSLAGRVGSGPAPRSCWSSSPWG